MGTMLLLIGGALFFALVTFILFEEKSLKNANFSDMGGLFTEERKPAECMQELGTVRYMVFYSIILIIADLIVVNVVFVPNGFGSQGGMGLQEVLAFTFIPAFVGSGIILLVKWTYQPVIKVISAMMYGFTFIIMATVSFAITYFGM